MKSFSWQRFNRKTHYWGAIICALPVLVIIGSGMFLMLKKESSWVQPPTQRGSGSVPTISFDAILAQARTVPESQIENWDDIDRLDVRPGKGVIKVRANNRWEIQLDGGSGEILQVAFRRSDLIESIHDGSFFHDKVRLFVFLPSAIVLLVLWITGIYLFVKPLLVKANRRKRSSDFPQDGQTAGNRPSTSKRQTVAK